MIMANQPDSPTGAMKPIPGFAYPPKGVMDAIEKAGATPIDLPAAPPTEPDRVQEIRERWKDDYGKCDNPHRRIGTMDNDIDWLLTYITVLRNRNE